MIPRRKHHEIVNDLRILNQLKKTFKTDYLAEE